MTVSASESLVGRWGALGELLAALAKGVPCLEAHALWGSARALLVAALVHETGRTGLVVTAGQAERHRATRDLDFFLDSLPTAAARGDALAGRRVVEFPPVEPASWRGARHRESDAERALCCHRLLDGGTVLIVATPAALLAPLLTPAEFRARTGRLAVGDTLTREDLLLLLDFAGYERVETVVEV